MNSCTLNVVELLQKTYDLEIDEKLISRDAIALRSVISTEEEVNKIVKDIEKNTNTKFNTRLVKRNPQRFIFRKLWICQHASYKKKVLSKRNTNCKSFIDITIKKVTINTRKRDKYLRHEIPYVCLIKTNLEHTHPTETPDALRFLRISPEIKAQFEKYFSEGLTPSEAHYLHESKLLSEKEYDILENASYNPTQNQLYYLYERWRKKNFGWIKRKFGSISDPYENHTKKISKYKNEDECNMSAAKRPRKEEAKSNAGHSSGSKVYIIKIVADKNSELKFQVENDTTTCTVSNTIEGLLNENEKDILKTEQDAELNLVSDENDSSVDDPSNSTAFQIPSDISLSGEIVAETPSTSSDEFKFQEKWLKQFLFLEYDFENNVMFCRICRRYMSSWHKNSPFVAGTAKFKVNVIRSHERSSIHTECLQLDASDPNGDEILRNSSSVSSKKISGWIANRHKLKFRQNWLIEYPFIEYDEANNLMFCRACRRFVNDWRKTSPFVVGTDNFRESMLKYHQRSSMHAECQDLADTLASEDCEEKDLYKEQLSHVFKSVYFIFKNKMPYTHYPQLCESQKREGTDFSVYTSHLKVVPLFGKFIAMAFEKELAKKICNVPEFSLIIDASFRRNIESHDLVYLKYLDRFTVRTVFLGVVDSSAKLHDSIYTTLSDLFKSYDIKNWVDKIVYIMTDKSDSRMWLEGFISLIKNMSPRNLLAEVKYLSHKIKYCASVVQNHKVTSTFDALLWSIYCYYERVDKAKKNLMSMNTELDEIIECYGSLPKNSYTTLYFEALKSVEEDYADLVHLLESEQLLLHYDFKVRKSGTRILSVITRCSFICKLALFIDIFSCLNDFAIRLSIEDTMPYDVHMLIDEVCQDIEKAAEGEGPVSLEIGEELASTPNFFRGIEIIEDSTLSHIMPEVKKFSQDVISYLKSIVDDDSLLEKCFIFNIDLWPEDEEISMFGNSEFVDIFKQFNGEEIKGDEELVQSALTEWNIFKSKLLSIFPYEVRQNSKSVILKMVMDFEDDFPFVVPVLKKILLLNFEGCEIKRGYHEMCLNKSYSRSMLSLQSLQTSMMVSMYGPSLGEFDYSLALELFLNSRHRKFRKKIIDKTLTLNYTSDVDVDEDEDMS